MQNFEQVRSHFSGRYPLRHNEPYLVSFDIPLDDGARRQGVYLAELEDEHGNCLLRISSPVGPMDGTDAGRCLRFNWQQRSGYLASGDLDGEDWLQLCENRPYRALDGAELDRLVEEIGTLADQLEQALAKPPDNV